MRRHGNPQPYSARPGRARPAARAGHDTQLRAQGHAEQPTERLPAIAAQAPRQRAAGRPAAAPRRSPARRGGGGRGLRLVIGLVGLVAIAVILVTGFQLASDNIIKPIVADRVENDIDRGVESLVTAQLASMPLTIDQPQEIMVSEAELNQRIDEQQNLGPLDDARAEINSDGVVVHMDAYGLSGKYHAQVGVADGRAVLRDGSISGPLGYVIPVGELEQVANEAIARSLSTSEIRVTQVTLVDGEMVLTLESTGAGNDTPTG